MADSQRKTALLHDNPLCGISTYKDTLNLATGVCTRQIKKLVLTGNESGWVMSGTGLFYNLYLSDSPRERDVVMSTHFKATHEGTLPVGTFRFGGMIESPTNPLVFNYDNGTIGLEAFKSWLASQYTNGTPVIVWFIPTTPTTETITVPTGLSGTEEGYLTQSETPTPTNPIYPTANEVLIWQHSLRKLTTATEAVENPLYSDGTAITAYTLKGNTVQNGTPTPSNPVEVNGVGEETINIYDGTTSATNARLSTSGTGTYAVQGWSVSSFIPINTSTNYCTNLSTQSYYCLYDENKSFLVGGIISNSNPSPRTYANAKFIRFDFPTDNLPEVQLSEGRTGQDYEPYGYKIPISNGQQTTNIYLGSTQTTRQIGKRVYNGSEDWRLHGSLANLFYLDDYQDGYADNTESGFAISNAFVQKSYTVVAGLSNGQFVYGTPSGTVTKRILMKNTACSTVEEWQTWLASNPVTVWYVLATATTGIVNEPLMKIGTYADSISNAAAIPTTEGANSITVDTTVQPSEFSATWTGWHNANVKEWDGSDWQ